MRPKLWDVPVSDILTNADPSELKYWDYVYLAAD